MISGVQRQILNHLKKKIFGETEENLRKREQKEEQREQKGNPNEEKEEQNEEKGNLEEINICYIYMASLINRKRDEPPEKKKGDNVTEQQPKKPSTDTENVKSQFEWECEECKQTTYDQTVCSVCVEPLVYRWFEVDDPNPTNKPIKIQLD